MNIKAKSKFNYKTVKAFTHAEVFRKSHPLKKMLTYCLTAVLLAAVLILEMYLLGPSVLLFVLLAASGILLLLELYLYFILPRLRYRALGEMKGCENAFHFLEDEFRVTSNDNGYRGESRVQYKVLHRVVETSQYMFLYQNMSRTYIVEKSSVSGGTPLELREKLQSILKDRYMIYKY